MWIDSPVKYFIGYFTTLKYIYLAVFVFVNNRKVHCCEETHMTCILILCRICMWQSASYIICISLPSAFGLCIIG